MKILIISLFVLLLNTGSGYCSQFYVDSVNGDDSNNGNISNPFKSFNKALEVVSGRVDQGHYGDDIILREGVYRNDGFSDTSRNYELYTINMKGTASNPSVISAMEGERVVFDDGYIITGPWVRYKKDIWMCNPGYYISKFSNGIGHIALGSRMVLQDGEPLLWVDTVEELTEGSRTYDKTDGVLYAWLKGDVDPDNVLIESWKGHHKSVRFRHVFGGSMEHVVFRGLEFRLFSHLFDIRSYFLPELGNAIMDNLTWENNTFSYGWVHLYSDIFDHTQITRQRQGWVVQGNKFIYPGREVFQVHGDNHVFADNEIVGHAHGYSGGINGWGALNLRHCNNVTVTNNKMQNKGSKWRKGAAIMFESDIEQQWVDGECIYGGAYIANNLFYDFGRGDGIYLGHSGCVMRDIVIDNNVFAVVDENIKTKNMYGISITSPHRNLNITNNIFYNLLHSLKVWDGRGGLYLEALSSSISINNNIIIDTLDIPKRLIPVSHIDGNIYQAKFEDVENFDFSLVD